MKAKDLKTGVVYINRTSERKGVIVSLDTTYQKPPNNIQRRQAVPVEERKGNGAGYLVLEARLNYPDERLLEEAALLARPVIGEVWPYVIADTSPYSHRLKTGAHVYPEPDFVGIEVPTYIGTRKVMPQPTIWLASQFHDTYSGHMEKIAERDAKLESQRKELIERRQIAESTSEQLYNRIKAVVLEDVELDSENSNPRPQSRPDGVYILVRSDVMDAVLKRAEL